MDPITGAAALSLVCNVFQVAEYSCKILDKGFEIYKSVGGFDAHNTALKACSDELFDLNESLAKDIASSGGHRLGDHSEDDAAIERLARQCNKEAQKLLKCLASVQGRSSGSRMHSLRQALKAAGKKDEIDAIASRMRNFRQAIDSTLIQSTNLRLEIMAVEQTDRFSELDKREKETLVELKRIHKLYVDRLGSSTDMLVQVTQNGHRQIIDMLQPILSSGRSMSRSPSPRGRSHSMDFVTNIHDLVEDGDKAAVFSLLNDDPGCLRKPDAAGRTALHIAAEVGNVSMLALLIRKGANVNAEDLESATPLHLAVKAGSVICARRLLLEGANELIADENHVLPAHYAENDSEMAWVLQNGGGVDARNPSKDTALIHFAKRGKADVVQSLIDQKADMEAVGSNGTALVQATLEGHDGVVDILLDAGANINARCNQSCTPLVISAQRGHTVIAQKLLQRPDIDLNVRTRSKSTALAEACIHGEDDIVILLIKAGADLETKCEEQLGPIHRASRMGATRVVAEILKRNSTLVNWRGRHDWTPLLEASANAHEQTVELLLAYHANTEARGHDAEGFVTPLLLASQRGHRGIVKLLLEKGHADMEVRAGNHGWTPLIYSIRHAFDIDTMHELVKHGANVHRPECNASLWPPLLHAAYRAEQKGLKMVEILVREAKADINARPGGISRTALCEAIDRDQPDMVEKLLSLGADPAIADADPNQDGDGRHYPPICLAALKSSQCLMRLVETAELMKIESFDLNACNKDGWTALHEAAFHDNLDLVKYLLSKGADKTIKSRDWAGTPLELVMKTTKANSRAIQSELTKE